MNSTIFKIISGGFNLFNKKSNKNRVTYSGAFKKSFYKFYGANNLLEGNGKTFITRIRIEGDYNEICLNGISQSGMFLINGNHNKITICSDVQLASFNLLVRGNNSQIIIGKGTSIGGVRIICVGNFNSVEIGENSMLSDNIEIWNSDTHPIYNEEGILINEDKPVYIGNQVWIGAKVNILKGVSIGDGAIIGMGSTVVKDVVPRSVNVGVPCKMIKKDVSWSKFYRQ